MNNSSYERQQEELRNTKEYNSRLTAINELKEKMKTAPLDSIITAMDYLRLAVATIGGEREVEFIEVYRNHIKAHTRMPSTSTIFPFLMASDNRNLTVSYALPKIMLECPYVRGIKIIPSQSRGSYIILETRDIPNVPSVDSRGDERQTTDS